MPCRPLWMLIAAMASLSCAREPALSLDQLALEALVRAATPLTVKTSGRTVTAVCLTRSWPPADTKATDPDSIVVARLNDVRPPVQPRSQCLKDPKPLYRSSPDRPLGPGIGDIPTRLDLLIDRPRWSSDTSASVVVAYSVDGLNAAEYTCTLRRRGNAVIVRECTLISISAKSLRRDKQAAG